LVPRNALPMRIDAVVFDYDDTLAETLPARIEAMRQTFEEAGITGLDPEAFVHDSRGVPLQTALDGFDNGHGKHLNLTTIYRRLYWHKEPGLIYLYEGVRSLLDSLLASQIPLGLLTSKIREISVEERRAGALVELEELGIDDQFMHIVGVEDVTHPKPHPEGLERILAHMGKRPECTLVVGDSWSDVEAARNAGCWSCLTAWASPDSAYQLLKTTPDFIARHPSDVLRLVCGDR
jgi:phosphoglycolate phosphatase-like HAD superfamily hydrolase